MSCLKCYQLFNQVFVGFSQFVILFRLTIKAQITMTIFYFKASSLKTAAKSDPFLQVIVLYHIEN